MQDNRTGLMHQVPASAAASDEAELRRSMDKTIPQERQGALFEEGEILEVKGGCFRVQKIIKKGLVLHGLPSPVLPKVEIRPRGEDRQDPEVGLVGAARRQLATEPGRGIDADVELVSWSGIGLMLHRLEDHGGHIKMADRFGCSHERTGFLIARGRTPEAALAMAIALIRTNWENFKLQAALIPTLNVHD